MSSDNTKTRILRAAGPIFAEKGFRDSTVREICAAASVNVASINYYFRDKDNLYLETVHFARETQDSKFPYPDWDAEVSPEEKLRGFIETLMRRIMALKDAQWQVRLLMNEVLHPTTACRTLVEEFFKPVFERLLTTIDELAGERLPNDLRKKIGFSVVGQCLYYRYAKDVSEILISSDDPEHFNECSLAEHVSSFSLAAIKSMIGQRKLGIATSSDSKQIESDTAMATSKVSAKKTN